VSVRFNRRGVAVDGPPVPKTAHPVRIGERDVGEVWLERVDGPALLDELIVERLALAARVLWRGSRRPGRSTASLIELVVSPGTAPDDRIRGVELLGLSHPCSPARCRARADTAERAFSRADERAIHNVHHERYHPPGERLTAPGLVARRRLCS
jgi:hypothetical protein